MISQFNRITNFLILHLLYIKLLDFVNIKDKGEYLMQVGIIGLPYSGKSTLFSTLLDNQSTGYKDPQKAENGIVEVPDERLDELSEFYQPEQKTNATVEYIKVPGFEDTDGEPSKLPGKFISNLKSVDAILMVVRSFENDIYPHPMNRIAPKEDIDFINSEMLLSDLSIIENRIDKLEESDPDEVENLDVKLDFLNKCYEFLMAEQPLRDMEMSQEEEQMLNNFQLLSLKPIIYAININDSDINKTEQIIAQFSQYNTDTTAVTALCAEVEQEISELDRPDQELFMEELGIQEPALNNLIRNSYELLGLISFFTVGKDECRAWTIKQGANAREAGGAIHSDIERGFIRAKVTGYNDILREGGRQACREKELLSLEDENYTVEDGDVMEFQFNV